MQRHGTLLRMWDRRKGALQPTRAVCAARAPSWTEAAANEARKLSVHFVGHPTIEQPAVNTIVPTQAVFHFEGPLGGEIFEVVGDTPGEVVGVHTFCPSVTVFLRERAPREGDPSRASISANAC